MVGGADDCYARSRFPGEGGFGRFLRAAIIESRCDRFARKRFEYAAGGLYDGDVIAGLPPVLRRTLEHIVSPTLKIQERIPR